MEKEDTLRLLPILRKLSQALNEERGYTDTDIKKAKAIATKLYMMHTNRDISLSNDDFSMILSIIEY